MERSKSCKVCVTGATGYIGSWLLKKLLHRGYTVHATLRGLKNESKVGFLKRLPHAEERLVLFEADIYNPTEFEAAIQGCEFVFHVATPLKHQAASQYKNMIEAAIAGSRSIAISCLKSGTVKRLIYTGSVVSTSPLKDNGSGFKEFLDETCWTPLIDSYAYLYHDDFHREYTHSKTLVEKELLSYGNKENDGGMKMEVVSLCCGLVGGETLQSFISDSVAVCVSQLTQYTQAFQSLNFLEKLLGKIPLVHIDDVCEAHIFCMENPSIHGRFLCANSFISSEEIANYFLLQYPEIQVKQRYACEPKGEIKWASTKLTDKGFVYKYDTKMILDDCIKSARRFGVLQ